MPDDAMLEAHVQFEVAAWTEELESTLQTEVAELFSWLESLQLTDVITSGEVVSSFEQLPLTDATLEVLISAVRSAHSAALEDDTTLAEVVRREDYNRLAASVIGMDQVQEAVIDQITNSEVYSQLIAHVLYHGIKNYAMTESPVARRVPGASSLMRLGQSAMDTAAPKLSKGIDRQLTAFVNANIQDSLRESRDYLTSSVDEDMMQQIIDEIWDSNADATVAQASARVPAETLAEFTEITRDAWEHLRTTPGFRALLTAAVDDFISENGRRTVADLLISAGVTPEYVTEQLRPWVAKAAESGFLEQRIRARLQAFYSSYRPCRARD